MANNPYVNKVQLADGTSLIDISSDTVTADKLMQGYTAHDRSGALITGTATGGGSGGNVWQDAQGYVHLDDEGTTPITVESLSVTQNGTYTAITGHAYSPVTVNVSGGGSSNYVTGTFTPSATTGIAETFTVPYTGTGYPIALLITLEEGSYNSSGTFYNTIHQYAAIMYCMSKGNLDAPTYSGGNANIAETMLLYKASNTSSGVTSTSRGNGIAVYDSSADATGSSATSIIRIKSATTISYYIASTSYGFRSGTEYRYHIMYSS